MHLDYHRNCGKVNCDLSAFSKGNRPQGDASVKQDAHGSGRTEQAGHFSIHAVNALRHYKARPCRAQSLPNHGALVGAPTSPPGATATSIPVNAKITKIAARPSDIDIVWLYGYGWPIYRGGPMFYADSVGLKHIADRLSFYAKQTNDPSLEPTSLLKKLAAEGKTFASLAKG